MVYGVIKMTDKPPELKACPFCGCKMSVKSNRDWHRAFGVHEINCVFWAHEPPYFPATDEGLEELMFTWNTRANTPADDKRTADVEVLRGVAKSLNACMDDLMETLLMNDLNCLTRQEAADYINKTYGKQLAALNLLINNKGE